jgi:hypothetical protein
MEATMATQTSRRTWWLRLILQAIGGSTLKTIALSAPIHEQNFSAATTTITAMAS